MCLFHCNSPKFSIVSKTVKEKSLSVLHSASAEHGYGQVISTVFMKGNVDKNIQTK